jgi:hypothetical protein
MGNTYAMVNERKKEWLRQWAKIMLIVEQSVSRKERLAQQSNYSKKMPDGSRILVTRLIQTVCLFSHIQHEFFSLILRLMNARVSRICVQIIFINFANI